MDFVDETTEIKNFSRIKFAGIVKKHKQNLKAMKKPGGNPPPSSVLSRIANKFIKSEGPPAKQMILTDNKHKWNPVTKRFEFEGDEEVKTEEFKPPPLKFANTQVKANKKLYVDVIGQDTNLSEYKPAVLEEKTELETLTKEENSAKFVKNPDLNSFDPPIFEKNELSQIKPEKNIESDEKILFLIKELENEKEKFKSLKNLMKNFLELPSFIHNEPYEAVNNYLDGQSFILLEKNIAELSSNLSEKSLEILFLHEKIVALENENKELLKTVEWSENEKNSLLYHLQEDNKKLSQEFLTVDEKYQKTQQILRTQVRDLQEKLERFQIKEKIYCDARVKSEANEKNLAFKVKSLEKDYNWAVGIIKTLEKNIIESDKRKFEYVKDLNNYNPNTGFVIENLNLTKEFLNLKQNFEILNEKNQKILLNEGHLNEKILGYEKNIKKLSQNISEIEKNHENEVNKIKSKHENEKKGFLDEINLLKATNQDVNQLVKEIEFLKNENLEVLNILQEYNQQETVFNEIIRENEKKMKNFAVLVAELKENCENYAKKEKELLLVNEKLTISNESLTESDRKTGELLKKSHSTEQKLLKMIENLENSVQSYKSLENSTSERLKSLENTIKTKETHYEIEIKELKSKFEEEINKKQQNYSLLEQEISIIKESSQAELKSLHNKLEHQRFVNSKLETEVAEYSKIRDMNDQFIENIEKKNRIIEDLEMNIKENSKNNEENLKKIEELMSENKDLDEKMQIFSLNLTNADEDNLLLTKNLTEIQTELKDTKNKLSSVEKTNVELEKQISSLNSEILEKNKKNSLIFEELQKLNQNYSQASEKISSLQIEKQELQEKLKNFEKEDKTLHLKTENEDLRLKFEELNLEKEKLQIDFLNSSKTVENLKYENLNFENTVNELQKNIEDSENKYNNLSEENLRLYEEFNENEAKLNQTLVNMSLLEENSQQELYNQKVTYEESLKQLQNKLNILEQELKYEKNEKTQILRDFNEVKMQKASEEKNLEEEKSSILKNKENYSHQITELIKQQEESYTTIQSLYDTIHKLEQLNTQNEEKILKFQQEIEEYKEENRELRETSLKEEAKGLEIQNSADLSLLSKEFFNSGNEMTDFFRNDESNEKWELGHKIKAFEDEKKDFEAQIESLSKEIDNLYEKNFALMQQNQVYLAEQKRKQENNVFFGNISELEKKLKEKDEELELIRQSFKELIEKTAENTEKTKNSNVKTNPDKGWVTSVIGSIFLTDKERGLE